MPDRLAWLRIAAVAWFAVGALVWVAANLPPDDGMVCLAIRMARRRNPAGGHIARK